eukprot:SAG31_NODE_1969_length_6771_cov_17.211331_7_plen_1242_part_01
MRMSALKKRALTAGVDRSAVDAVDDSEEPKEAIIGLLLCIAHRRGSSRSLLSLKHNEAQSAGKPHFGSSSNRLEPEPHGVISTLRASFGSKHCMLSYQWDHQRAVNIVRKQLMEGNVPVWMDVNGGMSTDIYNSMAEGVTNAACVVCFMTQRYQDSQNCALELKFALQSGIPIVPVMMEAPDESGRVWKAGGWLGIVTAGMLYTPLHDPTTFDENIQNLLRQVTIAVTSQAEMEANDTSSAGGEARAEFSIDDAREELERLRVEEIPATATEADPADGRCSVPPQVAVLPAGLRVSTEMSQLRRSLLTPVTKKTKLSFCGMGGVGKTTISAWLVRDDGVREVFDQVLWAALGQEPNVRSLQEAVYFQLTGNPFDDAKGREEQMRQAMGGKMILLVLDDLWDLEHEKALDFIDENTASKVLISSRVRGLLIGSEIVDIGVPTESEAIEMLLSAAGQHTAAPVPAEARAVVQFCNYLPLAIGMAGKLAQEIGLEGDWRGVVALLEEEFRESGQARSMEERVIRTSLNAIKGPQREKIVRTLHAFSVVPEDTRVPLEVMRMLYRAENDVADADGALHQPPTMLSMRRWLKVLLDRNLILGSVDRPSLHDIVKDFVVSAKTEAEHRLVNRRLVELWRAERPPGGWDVPGTESVSLYMEVAAAHHMRGAWNLDWLNDGVAIGWLADFVGGKQDAIPVFAADALGIERVSQLARRAEAARDWWNSSLYWSAAALAAHRVGGYSLSVPLSISSANALEHLDPSRDACTQQQKDQLEMSVLILPLQSYSADVLDLNLVPRLVQILERAKRSNSDAVDITNQLVVLQFGEKVPAFIGGNVSTTCAADVSILRCALAALEKVHRTNHLRRCQLLVYHILVSCWTITQHHPEFNWDDLYGKKGALLSEVAATYDYGCMNSSLRKTPWLGFDAILFPGYHALATCWGDFKAANVALDQMLPSIRACIANRDTADVFPLLMTKSLWIFWLEFLGRREDARALLHQRTTGSLESDFDWFEEVCDPGLLRPRGFTQKGQVWGSCDGFMNQAFFLDVLVAEEPALPSLLDKLPPPAQFAHFIKGSYCAVADWVSTVPAMLAHERCGQGDSAMAFTSVVLERRAWSHEEPTSWDTEWEFGTYIQHYFANSCRGRLLAAQSKLEAAESAFETAVTAAKSAGLQLLAALAVNDLCKHVLDTSGRRAQGQRRLQEEISRLDCNLDELDRCALPRGPVRSLQFGSASDGNVHRTSAACTQQL